MVHRHPRAVLPHRRLPELGLQPPKTLAELTETARKIRTAKPDLYGISVGGKYLYAALPYVWANGGDIAKQDGDKWTSAINSSQASDGLRQYAELIKDDICPPSQCAQLTGTQSVAAFAGGKAGMTIGGDFNRKAVEAGTVKGKYAVVPLPGKDSGKIAPAFAGGNLLGVFGATKKYTLSLEFVKLLGGKKYQEKMYAAMGNLPTFNDVQEQGRRERHVPGAVRRRPRRPAPSSCPPPRRGRRSTPRPCSRPRCSRSRPAVRPRRGNRCRSRRDEQSVRMTTQIASLHRSRFRCSGACSQEA